MKIFKDRQSAGKLLAKRLKGYQGSRGVIVLGIPRGGVVVAHEVAKELSLPLDILVTRKIGAPNQKELALGAVDPDGEVVWEQNLINDLGLKIEDLKEKVADEVEEIRRREELYRQGKEALEVGNKTVILTDDGIATGATTLAGIRYLKRHGARKIVLAVPVASKEAVERVMGEIGEMREIGEVIVLDTPEYFHAVGQFYHKFEPVGDEEVIQLLR